MPRRSRPVLYDDVIDDIDPEVYPSRTRGEPILAERVPRYGHGHGHRMPRVPVPPSPPSPPAPVVEMPPDRRHMRERVKPEIMPGTFEYIRDDVRDDVLAAERLARLDLNAYRNEEVSKYADLRKSAHKPKLQPRGRRRDKISDVEEAYYSTEDSEEGLTNSESEEEETVRKKGPISRRNFDPPKEVPRSKSLKEDARTRRSKYDDGGYTKSSHSLEEYTRDKKGPGHGSARRPHHRSHYHIDIEDEIVDSDDSDVSEVDVIPTRGRREPTRKDHIKSKYSARSRGTSSSLSSPESAGSSEDEELPKVPLPVPVPPVYKESKRHKGFGHAPITMPRPPSPPVPPTPPTPRVPSLETVLTEREARHRKRMEKAAKEEIAIEKRSRESLPMPQEPPSRRKKSKPVAIVDGSGVAMHREHIVEDEAVDPRVSYRECEREVIEEDNYRSREPQPARSSSLSEMDDWAIVQAPPKPKRSPEKPLPVVDVCEEPGLPRRKDRGVMIPEDETIRDPKQKGDTPRGKVGSRYIGIKDRHERLWTEITKDLVVREAIERAGYEYEEMDSVYYIFSYLSPDDVNALVEHSDDIRRARRRRIQEIQRERASMPPPSRRSPNKSASTLPERPPSPPMPPLPPRLHRENRREDRRRRERERERERDLVREEDIEAGRYRARSGRW
ncbi:uncharacterized protein BDV17DRAFT_178097 [Aspergillus undulatus]|uniref:uncharacterized protein n=1 Tax=Aspergillus undulatus TaxID=1810928 RepID=UPI003CCD3D26